MDALSVRDQHGELTVSAESPLGVDLEALFAAHHAFCHADTPPESIHMLDRNELAGQGLSFFVLRKDGSAIGMAALKRLDERAVELKSMHVLDSARGAGRAGFLMDAVLRAARDQGAQEIFLETGAQPSFAAARRFYLKAGFSPCAPFGSYRPDPLSVFMRRGLSPDADPIQG